MSFQIPDDYQLSASSGAQNISLPAGGGSSASSYDLSSTPSVTTRIPFGSSVSQGFFQSSGSGSGSFPAGGHGRYDDLKMMLESNKDGLKLEAMRRIIAMVAKGRSGDGPRELFPHVVKSVVTQNVELKKLVYLFLTRYAEQEQDLALLSVSSFQRSLKDPNPLIRACALRVLSSIRVPMIAPIMLGCIRESANDMSPYVRKTAAHAIPKLYALDPDMREVIIQIIERLLQDRTSLVLASAVYAFEKVCPDRIDLIHQNYRKFCALIADFDEWGQVILMNLLLRYARTQFVDPNKRSDSEPDQEKDGADNADNGDNCIMVDSDLRLLLRSVKPLLSSRNSSVAMAVIQLYLHLAPRADIGPPLVKPLIRLLHSHREIQTIVLANIVSLTSNYTGGEIVEREKLSDTEKANAIEHCVNGTTSEPMKANNGDDAIDKDTDDFFSAPSVHCDPYVKDGSFVRSLFEPHLKSFFIKPRDSSHVKIFKLEVLTNLANSANIPLILREFQAYIQNFHDSDVDFVSAVIHAIGICAARITEVSHICLNGLIGLLSNRNQAIVAHSIVVIRSQIVNHEASVGLIIKQITRLFDSIVTPQARATIIWILAEFCDRNNRAFNEAPDVLRKVAKGFSKESDLVKLQALNLAAKFHVTLQIKYGMEPIASIQTLTQENGVNGTDSSPSINDKEPQVVTSEAISTSNNVATRRKPMNEEKMKALIIYLFNLAKYDLNYDVRDRARFLKALIGRPSASQVLISHNAKKYYNLNSNEHSAFSVVTSQSGFQFKPSANLRMGTLSHFLGRNLPGYEELPQFPEVAPDRTVRDKPEPIAPPSKIKGSLDTPDLSKRSRSPTSFYSDESDEEDSDDSEEETSDDESEESESEEEEETEESEESSEEESEESEDESEEEPVADENKSSQP